MFIIHAYCIYQMLLSKVKAGVQTFNPTQAQLHNISYLSLQGNSQLPFFILPHHCLEQQSQGRSFPQRAAHGQGSLILLTTTRLQALPKLQYANIQASQFLQTPSRV